MYRRKIRQFEILNGKSYTFVDHMGTLSFSQSQHLNASSYHLQLKVQHDLKTVSSLNGLPPVELSSSSSDFQYLKRR